MPGIKNCEKVPRSLAVLPSLEQSSRYIMSQKSQSRFLSNVHSWNFWRLLPVCSTGITSGCVASPTASSRLTPRQPHRQRGAAELVRFENCFHAEVAERAGLLSRQIGNDETEVVRIAGDLGLADDAPGATPADFGGVFELGEAAREARFFAAFSEGDHVSVESPRKIIKDENNTANITTASVLTCIQDRNRCAPFVTLPPSHRHGKNR